MPVPVKTNESYVTLANPLPSKCAPATTTEFAQPLPGLPVLPHGPAVPDPSAEQNGVIVGATPRSRTKMSPHLFVSFVTRFDASLRKTTKRPSFDTLGVSLAALDCAPVFARLTRSVVCITRSRRKTSETPFVSPATR